MSDLVDQYIEPGSAGLFTRLTRVALRLEAVQRRCLEDFDLNFADYAALRVLMLATPDHQLLPTELSQLLLRTSGGITQLVDRLESRGLVERGRDAADRRKVVVRLTPGGHRLGELGTERYHEARSTVLADVDERELVEIDRAVSRLLELFDEESDLAAGVGQPT